MKRIFKTTIIVTIICVLGVVVFAQKKKRERDPCKDPMTQFEMNLCSRSIVKPSEDLHASIDLAVHHYNGSLSPGTIRAFNQWARRF